MEMFVDDDNSYNEPSIKEDDDSSYEPTYYKKTQPIEKLANEDFTQ